MNGAYAFMCSHYERLLYPEATTRHGAADRWDWGVTQRSLAAAQLRDQQINRIVHSLTPAQRAELWADPSPEAAEFRRRLR